MQHFVARQPYGVEDSPLLQVLIDVRLGECGIGPKVPAHPCRPVARQDRIQYITPPVRAMYVPRTEHRALAVTELVEHEQRVIARATKVTVVRCSLLFSMYRALRTVHVQDHSPVRRAGHSSVHPLGVQSAQPFYVAVLRKHLGLEPAHGVGASRRSVYASVSNDYPHRRIVGQPFSIVGILVACQTTVHRLPEKAHQSVLHVAAAPSILQTLTRRLCQSQRIVQLAAGQQLSVRGDGDAVNSNRIRRSKRSLAQALVLSPIVCLQNGYVIKN